jgi:hypothetical protein
MSTRKRGSVPLNQPIKLLGGATITRSEMAALFKSKNIILGKDFTFKGKFDGLNHDKCGDLCYQCQFDCRVSYGTPESSFEELFDAEAAALLFAGKIPFSALSVAQLQAIRPAAVEILQNSPGLEKQLTPEQLKAIKG